MFGVTECQLRWRNKTAPLDAPQVATAHATPPDPARKLYNTAHGAAPLVPMQRAGTAGEVAQAIVWLLSEDSSYTTGAVVDVTGGR